MPYSGSFYTELNRFKINGVSTRLIQGAGDYIFCSLFGVPNEFRLERIRMITGDLTLVAGNNIDLRILSDPGKYREAEASISGAGEPYVILAAEGAVTESGPNAYWLYDDMFDPCIMVNDNLKSNSIHFMILSEGALTANATFNIYVEGYKIPEIYETTHLIGQARHDNRLLKVLRNDVLNDLWYVMGNTINPDYNKNAAIQPFVLATDYVYFGMEEEWNGLWFHINSPNANDKITATWEYYDGSAWSSLTVRDNCTDAANVSETLFNDSGVIEWDSPTDWTPVGIDVAKVSTDPPYDNTSGFYAEKWIPRYWVRCNIDDTSDAPTFYWIRENPSVI